MLGRCRWSAGLAVTHPSGPGALLGSPGPFFRGSGAVLSASVPLCVRDSLGLGLPPRLREQVLVSLLR